ncbi:MAG: diguanylate cyclase [Planctomycetes bacterium]|nr:diguanylate cyclase [Planctomycetota bacterium]
MTESPRTQGSERRALYSVAQIQHLLRVEFQRAQRYGYPLACLVLSIDQLGTVRDRLGYEAKEQVFDAVARLVHSRTRASDFLGRTADDRLLLVVPHTTAAGLAILCDRLVAETRARDFGDAGRITLSIGWAELGGARAAFHDELLARAEAAHADSNAAGGDQSRCARS